MPGGPGQGQAAEAVEQGGEPGVPVGLAQDDGVDPRRRQRGRPALRPFIEGTEPGDLLDENMRTS